MHEIDLSGFIIYKELELFELQIIWKPRFEIGASLKLNE